MCEAWLGTGPHPALATGINRTKTGLLLVIVGLIIGPFPYVMYVGSILIFIGVIMVILARNSFPSIHSGFVIGSVVVYLLGLAIYFVSGLVFGFSVAQAVLSRTSAAGLTESLTSAFNGFLVWIIIGSTVTAVALVLFTFALQDRSGRLLLYAAFALNLGLVILTGIIVSHQLANAVSQSFQNGSFDPTLLRSLQSQQQDLQLLGIFPSGLFGLAYYKVYHRISTGEIFQPTTPEHMVGRS